MEIVCLTEKHNRSLKVAVQGPALWPTLIHTYMSNRGSKDRAIAQAVSHQLPTTAARVWSQVRSCGICAGQSDTGAVFSKYFGIPYKFSFHQLLYTLLSLFGAGKRGQLLATCQVSKNWTVSLASCKVLLPVSTSVLILQAQAFFLRLPKQFYFG
jgi:hypothetical protein